MPKALVSIKAYLFKGNQTASSLSISGDNGFPTSTANIPMATSNQTPEYAEIPEGIFYIFSIIIFSIFSAYFQHIFSIFSDLT